MGGKDLIRSVSWTPSYKQYLYHSYFGFSAFFFKQVKLLQLIKSKQSKNAPEFKKKSVYILHLINVVKIKCRNLGGSKKVLNLKKQLILKPFSGLHFKSKLVLQQHR